MYINIVLSSNLSRIRHNDICMIIIFAQKLLPIHIACVPSFMPLKDSYIILSILNNSSSLLCSFLKYLKAKCTKVLYLFKFKLPSNLQVPLRINSKSRNCSFVFCYGLSWVIHTLRRFSIYNSLHQFAKQTVKIILYVFHGTFFLRNRSQFFFISWACLFAKKYICWSQSFEKKIHQFPNLKKKIAVILCVKILNL